MQVGGGAEKTFSPFQSITVPANGTATISASNVTKVICNIVANDVTQVSIFENGTNTQAVINGSVRTDVSVFNVYVTYANNTITLHSQSGTARTVWVSYC